MLKCNTPGRLRRPIATTGGFRRPLSLSFCRIKKRKKSYITGSYEDFRSPIRTIGAIFAPANTASRAVPHFRQAPKQISA
jgi:hypothetical protein